MLNYRSYNALLISKYCIKEMPVVRRVSEKFVFNNFGDMLLSHICPAKCASA